MYDVTNINVGYSDPVNVYLVIVNIGGTYPVHWQSVIHESFWSGHTTCLIDSN